MISGTLLAWINTRFESVSFLKVLFGLLDKFDGFVPHLLWFLASFANFTSNCWLHERSASDCNRWLTRLWWAIIFLPRRSCGCRRLTTSRMVVSPLVFLIILLILVSIWCISVKQARIGKVIKLLMRERSLIISVSCAIVNVCPRIQNLIVKLCELLQDLMVILWINVSQLVSNPLLDCLDGALIVFSRGLLIWLMHRVRLFFEISVRRCVERSWIVVKLMFVSDWILFSAARAFDFAPILEHSLNHGASFSAQQALWQQRLVWTGCTKIFVSRLVSMRWRELSRWSYLILDALAWIQIVVHIVIRRESRVVGGLSVFLKLVGLVADSFIASCMHLTYKRKWSDMNSIRIVTFNQTYPRRLNVCHLAACHMLYELHLSLHHPRQSLHLSDLAVSRSIWINRCVPLLSFSVSWLFLRPFWPWSELSFARLDPKASCDQLAPSSSLSKSMEREGAPITEHFESTHSDCRIAASSCLS